MYPAVARLATCMRSKGLDVGASGGLLTATAIWQFLFRKRAGKGRFGLRPDPPSLRRRRPPPSWRPGPPRRRCPALGPRPEARTGRREQGRSDSNAQPLVLETSALPIELHPFTRGQKSEV